MQMFQNNQLKVENRQLNVELRRHINKGVNNHEDPKPGEHGQAQDYCVMIFF
jgi:hypothetical protein